MGDVELLFCFRPWRILNSSSLRTEQLGILNASVWLSSVIKHRLHCRTRWWLCQFHLEHSATLSFLLIWAVLMFSKRSTVPFKYSSRLEEEWCCKIFLLRRELIWGRILASVFLWLSSSFVCFWRVMKS